MLTTDGCVNVDIGDYVFKSSPESCSDTPYYSPDYMDITSDEDFIQQLSSDLDIPLLLNSGEDEMSLLNAFLDRSPEDILSEISSSPSSHLDYTDHETEEFSKYECLNVESTENKMIKLENYAPSSASSDTSNGNYLTGANCVLQNDKNKPKLLNISVPVLPSISKREATPINIAKPLAVVPKLNSTRLDYIKQEFPVATTIAIQPKNYPNINNKFVVISNTNNCPEKSSIISQVPPKVVVLDNISGIPVKNITVSQLNKIIHNNSNHIDPKHFKRQQRKIKNRESACLSRKKKKDYVTSLELRIKELTEENLSIKKENDNLKMQLAHYQSPCKPQRSPIFLSVKSKMTVCMFLLVIGLNFNLFGFSFDGRGTSILQSNSPPVGDYHGRNLLWAEDTETQSYTNKTGTYMEFSMCPAAINQTESARLVLELERWIGKPSNVTRKTRDKSVNNTTSSKFLKMKYPKKRKYNIESPIDSPIFGMGRKLKRYPGLGQTNEIQVFSPSSEQLYSEFFEAINRQKDTFYVVSFSDHHMLLPALHHNRTRRPKMSLIMPSLLQNNLSHPTMVPLMQIDCEVLDTRLIHVKYGAIPQHLRKPSNLTSNQTSEESSTKHSSQRKYTKNKPYKPYFLNYSTQNNHDNLSDYNFN